MSHSSMKGSSIVTLLIALVVVVLIAWVLLSTGVLSNSSGSVSIISSGNGTNSGNNVGGHSSNSSSTSVPSTTSTANQVTTSASSSSSSSSSSTSTSVNTTTTTTILYQALSVGGATATPTNPWPGNVVTLSASAASGGVGSISYQWLMLTPGNTSYVSLSGDTSNTATIRFGSQQYGVYTFKLHVHDSAANSINSTSASVTYSTTPGANAIIGFGVTGLVNVSTSNQVLNLSINGVPLSLNWGQMPYNYVVTTFPTNIMFNFTTPIVNGTGQSFAFGSLSTPTCANVTYISSSSAWIGNVLVTGPTSQTCYFNATYT